MRGLEQSQGHDRAALILYGSETGNAQEVAEEVGRILERLRFVTRVSELNAVGVAQLLNYTLVIFVISTTGQGDLPANAQTFWKSLRSTRLQPECFADLQFATFGLGDSSYPKFNWAHRKLYNRLIQLSGQPIAARGEADERHPEGVDGAFLPWSITLRDQIQERYPLKNGLQPIPDDVLLQPKWVLEQKPADLESGEANTGDANLQLPVTRADGYDSLLPISGTTRITLVENQRITPTDHWQDVRHLTLEAESNLDYGPGDVLTIFPRNLTQDVDSLIALMNWESVADIAMQFVAATPNTNLPLYPPQPFAHLLPGTTITIRSMLTNYLDITSIPRRSFFSLIAHFTEEEMQKERLLEFTKLEYLDEFYDYTTRPRRSIIEVLQEFDTVKIPWQWCAAVFPVLRGRQFSIASGGKLNSDLSGKSRVELLVAIVKYRTVIKKIREGVCTRYIAGLRPGQRINVLLQKGGLDVSWKETNRPVILVGPGTGVAPLRSMIYQRQQWKAMVAHERDETPVVNGVTANGAVSDEARTADETLFFGCRNEHADYFFNHEWRRMEESRQDFRVFSAFSRDQKVKVYVQDLLRQQSALVYERLYRQAGLVYICGSSGKMPQAVREALIEVFQKEGNISRQDAEQYLIRMEKDGRYKQETW